MKPVKIRTSLSITKGLFLFVLPVLLFCPGPKASAEMTIRVVEPVKEVAIESTGWPVAFSPDASQLAVIREDRDVALYDVETGQVSHVLTTGTYRVNSVAFSSDGGLLATTNRESGLLWNTASGEVAGSFSPGQGGFAVALSTDRRYVLVPVYSGAWLQDLRGEQGNIFFFPDPYPYAGEVRSLAFSPNGSLVAAWSDRGGIRIWDAATGADVAVLSVGGLSHLIHGSQMRFTPDGSGLLTLSEGGAGLWDVSTGALLKSYGDSGTDHYGLGVSATGAHLMTGALDTSWATLWETETGSMVRQVRHGAPFGESCMAVAFSLDERQLFTAGGGKVQVWWSGLGPEALQISSSQLFNPLSGKLSLRASVNDLLYGPVTKAAGVTGVPIGFPKPATAFLWTLADATGTIRASGSLTYSSTTEDWRASQAISEGMGPGAYTISYAMTSSIGRVGTLSAPLNVTIAGDVSGDCQVNILDLIQIRNSLNQDPSVSAHWAADVNEDGRINILDLILVRNWLGSKCS